MNKKNEEKTEILKPIEKIKLIEKIAVHLQSTKSTSEINILLMAYDIEFEPIGMAASKKIYVREILKDVSSDKILKIGIDLELVDNTPNIVSTNQLDKIDIKYIDEQISKCHSKIREADFDGAITNSRTLVESVCIFVIKDSGKDYDDDGNLNKLYKKTAEILNMNPANYNEDFLKQICSGFFSIVNGLSNMRNELGDAHGKSKDVKYRADIRHALLAVNSAKTISDFIIMSYLK